MRRLACAAPGMIVAVLLLSPFLHSAFTIDDTLFLRQAEHALVEPLHPTAFVMTWDAQPMRMSSIMPSGPVMAWLLIPSAARGGVEWIGHLVGLAALLLAVLATVQLAFTLDFNAKEATWAGLIVATTPAVLGMAGTCMPDVPALLLGTLAMERFCAWLKEHLWHQALLASLALALAALTRSQLLLLVGVQALWGWKTAPRPRAWWLPLVLGALLLAIAMRLTRDPLEGSMDIAGSARFLMTLRSLHINLTAFPVHWVFALPLALPWAVLHHARLRWKLFAWLLVPFAVVITVSSGPRFVSVAFAAALGLVVLVDIVESAWKSGDAVAVGLAAWLLLALPVILYVHLPSKYLVPSAPAVALLVLRALRNHTLRWLPAVSVAVGAVVSVLILRANATFAELGRRAARELVAAHVQKGETVWFAGHWGFQWYAERAGGRVLTTTPPVPAPGDGLVTAHVIHTGEVLQVVPHRQKIGMLSEAGFGGRTMSRSAGAGFFSNGWGFLPWSMGCDELERFEYWRVER
jgi:hypothetical protein